MSKLVELLDAIAPGTSKFIDYRAAGMTPEQFTAEIERLEAGALPEGLTFEIIKRPNSGSGTVELVRIRRAPTT